MYRYHTGMYVAAEVPGMYHMYLYGRSLHYGTSLVRPSQAFDGQTMVKEIFYDNGTTVPSSYGT
jgi:hypothetical protein